MALDTVTLHGQILAPVTNAPAVGTITFKILTELRDNVSNIIYGQQTYAVTLDGTGSFSIVLPTTDNPDISPINWTYWVYVDTDIWTELFYMPLPSDMGDPVQFADLLPISNTGSGCTPDGSACAPSGVVGQIAALQAEVDALEAEVDQLVIDISGFQAQIDALDMRVDDVEADLTALQGQVNTLDTTVSALVGQVNTISPIVFANQAAIVVLQGQVTTIQGQITTIQGQITTLQGQVATNTANITTLQGQVSTLQGQVTTLQGQVSTLQTDLAALSANTVLLNPTSAGTYVGNTFTPPPNPSGTQPWLKSAVIPFSAGDTNFDIIRFRAQDEFGNTVNTGTYNGNGEGRDRPSARNRVARRTFESAEAVGGSTQQFVQWSTDATIAANREPLLGGWGTANASKPGWIEATRVLSGLTGVSIGGTINAAFAPYNTLSAFNYRGLKATAGPPTSGTWAVNDAVLDSLGVLYRCTVAGTPGTWVGNVPDTSQAVVFTGNMGNAALINDGNVANTGAPYAATTTLHPSNNRVFLDGNIANNGGVSIPAQTTLFTVVAAHAPARWVQFTTRTAGNLAVRLTIKGATGVCVADQPMAAGTTMNLDGFNWRKAV